MIIYTVMPLSRAVEDAQGRIYCGGAGFIVVGPMGQGRIYCGGAHGAWASNIVGPFCATILCVSLLMRSLRQGQPSTYSLAQISLPTAYSSFPSPISLILVFMILYVYSFRTNLISLA